MHTLAYICYSSKNYLYRVGGNNINIIPQYFNCKYYNTHACTLYVYRFYYIMINSLLVNYGVLTFQMRKQLEVLANKISTESTSAPIQLVSH